MVAMRSVPWVFGLLVLGLTLATRVGMHDSGAAVSSTMHANVGPGFIVSLTYDDGTNVASPPAGSYRILVTDQANDHNFHLIGPGVDMQTGTEQIGSATWTVTFQNNSQYVFQCDTHPAEMNGIFTVGKPVTTTPSASTTTSFSTGLVHPPPPLTATVNGHAATLRFGGKRVSSLKAGLYRVTVTDSSAKAGLKLQRIGHAATSLTTPKFVGRHGITVKLTAGPWKYYSSARAASAVVFTVTAK
jgi:hypothetical protein